MTDLSYTNKDGLNLYEGFDNGFDYHRDGAAEGDGYAHGGYPEITGETSDYTDTSYRTGDNPDFFNNGNVWETIKEDEDEVYSLMLSVVMSQEDYERVRDAEGSNVWGTNISETIKSDYSSLDYWYCSIGETDHYDFSLYNTCEEELGFKDRTFKITLDGKVYKGKANLIDYDYGAGTAKYLVLGNTLFGDLWKTEPEGQDPAQASWPFLIAWHCQSNEGSESEVYIPYNYFAAKPCSICIEALEN